MGFNYGGGGGGGQGPAGAPGASFLSGDGPPTNSLGNDGDQYVDLQAQPQALYEKASGTWSEVGTIGIDLSMLPEGTVPQVSSTGALVASSLLESTERVAASKTLQVPPGLGIEVGAGLQVQGGNRSLTFMDTVDSSRHILLDRGYDTSTGTGDPQVPTLGAEQTEEVVSGKAETTTDPYTYNAVVENAGLVTGLTLEAAVIGSIADSSQAVRAVRPASVIAWIFLPPSWPGTNSSSSTWALALSFLSAG